MHASVRDGYATVLNCLVDLLEKHFTAILAPVLQQVFKFCLCLPAIPYLDCLALRAIFGKQYQSY
jgi:hypothetical protein